MTGIKALRLNSTQRNFYDMDMELVEKQNRRKHKRVKDTKIDKWWSKLSHRHPFLAFVLFLTGLPLCSLAAVVSVVSLFVVPMALIFGWM